MYTRRHLFFMPTLKIDMYFDKYASFSCAMVRKHEPGVRRRSTIDIGYRSFLNDPL
jgi:hypothetical protein